MFHVVRVQFLFMSSSVLSRTSSASFGQRWQHGGGAVPTSFNRRVATAADPPKAAQPKPAEPPDSSDRKEDAVDTLLMPAKLLTFGPAAVSSSKRSQSMAAEYMVSKQAMVDVLQRRKPIDRQQLHTNAEEVQQSSTLSQAQLREPKFKHLASAALSAIVDDIRPPDRDDFIAALRKDTQAAVLAADKPGVMPSSKSSSSYLQLKRIRIERAAEGDKFETSGKFLQPAEGSPPRRPKWLQPLSASRGRADPQDEVLPTPWVVFPS